MQKNMDQILVSSWFNLHSSVPLSYVQPPESRPGELAVAAGKSIPVIDLGGHDRAETLQKVLKASEEYGFFQVINHGVSADLIEDTLSIFKEFYAMPAKEKMSECSKDPNGSCKLYTSREINSKDEVQYWRDTLRHACPPSGEYMEYWPQKPARYREVVGEYTQELRRLGLKILELICEGLGLAPGYFNGALTENPTVLAHHYPPCPEPSLTLGSPKHRDPTVITILLQDKEINALQVLRDGEWIGVEPIPNAFVVNIGLLLQIISNGKLVGAEHRVVTNSRAARTTVAYFINPSNETIIEPAKTSINSSSSPKYKSISFEEFRRNFFTRGTDYVEELMNVIV
ncbi:hypothetical protein L6164_007591 [Bauhinia variegata]|uniref:Uncharacterized protein n=1 Tax=Bauhinia variegata TaxID=167791 RepID=A0ACB9PFK7_BAUVA|nr:hypothetical protein L6164_007591 [Bauhinia variegata]